MARHWPAASGNPVGFFLLFILKLAVPERRNLRISFHFRTYHKSGMLFYSQSTLFVVLALVSGRLEIQPYIEGKQEIQHNYKFRIGKELDDGNWHVVTVESEKAGFILSVDGDRFSWKKPKQLKAPSVLSFKAIVFGYPFRQHPSFNGCLKELKVNKNLVTAKEAEHSGLQFNKCPITNLCFPNPCKHEGKCINTINGYSCNCTGVFYTGRLCHDPLYRASCQEYAKLGLRRDSVCSVVPMKNETSMPFNVMCKMMGGSSIAVAVIENMENGWRKLELDTSDAVGS